MSAETTEIQNLVTVVSAPTIPERERRQSQLTGEGVTVKLHLVRC